MTHINDHARDKVDLIFESVSVHHRAGNILEAAIGQLMARLCYTRAEAVQAARKYFAEAPMKRAPKRRSA